jgi:hypothetical protein
MHGTSPIGFCFCLLLVLCTFFSGCSGDTPADVPVPPAPTDTGPRYAEGDIIATPSTATASSLFLILDYDAAADEYTRAFIEKNADGTWGHRTGSRTERSPRALVEKVYTVRVGHIAVSSVPVVTPSILSPTTVLPASAQKAPTITKISPVYAAKGSAVGVSITGQNFEEGATVKLVLAGTLPITATAVTVTPAGISCVFDLNGRYDGSYNLIVTNPDGQSAVVQGGFTIGEALPVITSVVPISAGLNETIPIAVYGQNFRNNIRVTFTKDEREIVCMNPITLDSLKISCNLDLAMSQGASVGDWTVTVLNVDSQKRGTWVKKFTVTNATADTD